MPEMTTHTSKTRRGHRARTSTGPDRVEEARQRLADATATLATSDGWRAYLAAVASFHNYSPRNCLLLAVQGARGQVAGYGDWQKHKDAEGRPCQVAKIEEGMRRGMKILAPIVVKNRDEGADPDSKRLAGFRLVTVFDETQLVAPPADLAIARPACLEGDAPAHLAAALADQITAAGFTLTDDPLPPEARGVTRWAERTVSLAPDLSPAQQAKTLAHELAHVLMHDPTAEGAEPISNSQREIEAESVACIVTELAGLNTDDYSVPYVTGWAGTDDPAARMLKSAERITTTARAITAALPDTTPSQEN